MAAVVWGIAHHNPRGARTSQTKTNVLKQQPESQNWFQSYRDAQKMRHRKSLLCLFHVIKDTAKSTKKASCIIVCQL